MEVGVLGVTWLATMTWSHVVTITLPVGFLVPFQPRSRTPRTRLEGSQGPRACCPPHLCLLAGLLLVFLPLSGVQVWRYLCPACRDESPQPEHPAFQPAQVSYGRGAQVLGVLDGWVGAKLVGLALVQPVL